MEKGKFLLQLSLDGPKIRCQRATAETPVIRAEGDSPVAMNSPVVVCCGHLDNRSELAAQLGGDKLCNAADDVILKLAFLKWDQDFPRRVLGQFAFAVLDMGRQRVLAGTDGLGIGRLFYTFMAGVLWLSSDLDQLLKHLPEQPGFETQALAEYMARGWLKRGGTIYAGIREVGPGELLVWTPNRLNVTQYWPPVRSGTLMYRDPRDYEYQFLELLTSGIRASVQSGSDVALDLSGGLDSSTIACIAARMQHSGEFGNDRVVACSLVASQSASCDESRFQNEVAKTAAIERVTFDLDADQPFSYEDGELPCQPHAGFFWPGAQQSLVRFATSGRFGTYLTGVGGDAVFCGGFPPAHLSGLFWHLHWRSWSSEFRNWAGTGEYSLWALLRFWTFGCLRQEAGRPSGIPPNWLSTRFRKRVADVDPNEPHCSRTFGDDGRELQYRLLRVHAETTSRLARYANVRHPLLYRPLVEFMLAIPWDQKITATTDRVLQRRALRGVLPDSVRLRRTKGSLEAVIHNNLRRAWREIRIFSEGRYLADLGLVEPREFYEGCRRFRYGVSGYEWRFYLAALSLERWLLLRDLGVSDSKMGSAVDHLPFQTTNPS